MNIACSRFVCTSVLSAPCGHSQGSGKETQSFFQRSAALQGLGRRGRGSPGGPFTVVEMSGARARRDRGQMLVRVTALPPMFLAIERFAAGGSEVGGIITKVPTSNTAPPNPSFKRTLHGKPRLAFISFSAKRASPRRSA